MPIKKKYSSDKKICHVNFVLPKEISENFGQVSLVGDFNDRDIHKDKFSHKSPNGLFSTEYDLGTGKEYQFRYLCNGPIWLNEPEADKQVLNHYGDSKNSVIVL
jgi:1,4-alpha-glucan branching enzyme